MNQPITIPQLNPFPDPLAVNSPSNPPARVILAVDLYESVMDEMENRAMFLGSGDAHCQQIAATLTAALLVKSG